MQTVDKIIGIFKDEEIEDKFYLVTFKPDPAKKIKYKP